MDKGIDNLKSAKKLLNTSLEKLKYVGFSVERSGYGLEQIDRSLLSLEVAVGPIRARADVLGAAGGHINRAVVPAAAVLKVFDAIHGLEKSLSNPQSDLPGYLGILRQLEEAVGFLGENCGMAIQWLADVVVSLEDQNVAGGRFVSRLKEALRSLREVEAGEEKGGLDGGLFEAALDRLEDEFRRLLAENSVPLSMPLPTLRSLPGRGEQASVVSLSIPVAVLHKLHAILGTLVLNNRLDKCMSIYVEVRSANARASLLPLGLDYLELSVSEFNSSESAEAYVSHWGKNLEFAVKHLFEAEYKLCNNVFERTGSNMWKSCFAQIAIQSGILTFLQFGRTVAESKKEAIKLLMLLDIFTALNKLRPDFNRLFGGDTCAEIQNLTRDLIKKVIEGTCEIFWELPVQVELQRRTPPPADCNVPRVVTFVIDYSNKILGDDYKPILTQVLAIERSWKHKKYQERMLINEICNLVKAVDLNLETWSKGYGDAASSYLFLMNSHWHLHKRLKGTKLGSLLGDSWLSKHEQYKEHYSTAYLRESWGKFPALLSREGLVLFSGARATAREQVKQQLKSFNEAFDDMYRRQLEWIISDKDLQERMCRAVIQTVVPSYRSYMQSYGALVKQDPRASNYAKYTAQSLEKMLHSLFHAKEDTLELKQTSDEISNSGDHGSAHLI